MKSGEGKSNLLSEMEETHQGRGIRIALRMKYNDVKRKGENQPAGSRGRPFTEDSENCQ